MTKNFAIAVHGGAGTILPATMTPAKEKAYKDALQEAISAGSAILEKNGTALDAVEAAVISLENCPLFNAGKGSVFTHNGNHEMDASIMNGSDRKAGAVSSVHNVKNPIKLARAIMESSENVLLCGEGAELFAKKMNLDFETDEYFFDQFRYDQFLEIRNTERSQLDHSEKKFGTVGAVALDNSGHLAAATSTGGMTNKWYGRIGDSPVIGAGTYANDFTCAVSCTGHGEHFLRGVVAYDVSCLMEYKGLSLREACEKVIMQKLEKGTGGLIAIDKNGIAQLPFNTDGMYRAWKDRNGSGVAIYL